MENDFDLNMELNQTYEQLANVAMRQRALAREREALEEQRDHILYQLGKLAHRGARWDVT
jgi:hypothetical protein